VARSNTGFVCHVHESKVSYEIHHVFPLGYGGKNVASNKVQICCNAHSDIHFLMELMFKGKPWEPRDYGMKIRALAQSGYDQVMAHAEALAQDTEERNARNTRTQAGTRPQEQGVRVHSA
jgi:hypothetical protein